MDISVVVPVRNVARYVEHCIHGLLSQDCRGVEYEIIMVDNNSADDSAAIVRRYPSIRLFTEERVGAYRARNRGVAASNAPLVAFTDPDCVPESDWLQNILTAMQAPDVHVVLGFRAVASDATALSMLFAYEATKDEWVLTSDIKDLYYGYTNNMAVRKAAFDETGPFLNRVRGSDTILVRRVVDRYSCNAVRYCPAARVRHLEMNSLSAYYRKVFVYGFHSLSNNRLSYGRALSRRERLDVFAKAIREQKYPMTKSALLLCLLGIGQLAWNLGTRSQTVSALSVGRRARAREARER